MAHEACDGTSGDDDGGMAADLITIPRGLRNGMFYGTKVRSAGLAAPARRAPHMTALPLPTRVSRLWCLRRSAFPTVSGVRLCLVFVWLPCPGWCVVGVRT